MLEYAEKYLYGRTPEGQNYLKAFVNDFDKEFENLVKTRGYKKTMLLPADDTTADNTSFSANSAAGGISFKKPG